MLITLIANVGFALIKENISGKKVAFSTKKYKIKNSCLHTYT